ncbi:MAG: phosphonate ABC transporter, permease protein PhnE [Anaerolineales bacterium]|nr:phosphonate ABC transporter, permease protein PhnE [Anaerolineales bacterium]
MSKKEITKREGEIKPSLVPPILSAILSAILPGLGQALARDWRRGLTMFLGFSTSFGLLVWRFQSAARRDVGFIDIFKKAIRIEPILIWLTIATIAFWIWTIADAYLTAKRPPKKAVGIFLVMGIVFASLGWQIGQVDLVKLITEINDAERAVNHVMWPWSRAVTRPVEYVEPEAYIQVPCTDTPFAQPEVPEGEPYLISDPTCGDLAVLEGERGTELTLTGGNFIPGEQVTIKWYDPLKVSFTHRQDGEFMQFPVDENGSFEVKITMPYRLVPPSASEEAQKWTVFAQQVIATGSLEPSEELKLVVEKMIETIFIGMMATAFGIILALPVSFLAARNLMSASPVTLAIYYLVRTILNLVRSIEPVIWAIIFVIIVGLGPFAGILALTIHSIAALGKLYSESIESIDSGPIEAIQATGANWIQTVMFAVVPQIIPPFVSFTIYRWDINIRMSTVVGLVGGGGIGYLLIQWINKTDFRAAGIAVWFIAVTVAILDYISAEIRERYV